jgi:hypothetical protein
VSGKGGAIGLLQNTDGVMVMNFEEFLQDSGTYEFRVRATPGEGGMNCCIHPLDRNGATFDFFVCGDIVTITRRIGIPTSADETILIETSEDAA